MYNYQWGDFIDLSKEYNFNLNLDKIRDKLKTAIRNAQELIRNIEGEYLPIE
jgi:hypothetical protein